MDPADRQNLSIDDLFEESLFANRLFLNPRQFSDHPSEKEAFDFNIQDSIDHFIKKEEMPLPEPLQLDECPSLRNDLEADDTNQFEEESRHTQNIDEFPELVISNRADQAVGQHSPYLTHSSARPHPPNIHQLQKVISYLIEHASSSLEEVKLGLAAETSEDIGGGVVWELVQKFSRLKKTKQQLVKYCMRKAFKFILQLPKNKHLLEMDREEKFSFSKCKNRFLKNISDEKSMNTRFLQQIFGERDFPADYSLFLAHFDRIIEDDNQKKVRYLAQLLTTEKQGKGRTVEMVRRLPWTRGILDRVKKIARQLMKYSNQG